MPCLQGGFSELQIGHAVNQILSQLGKLHKAGIYLKYLDANDIVTDTRVALRQTKAIKYRISNLAQIYLRDMA